MPSDLLAPGVTDYLLSLTSRHDDPVANAMELHAAERRFPIVGRLCGVQIAMYGAAIGARRVFELGSGFGYSAMWWAKGGATEIHCTDGDQANCDAAQDWLTRARVWDRISYYVGDALTSFAAVDGEFDVVYNDVDKDGYPDCWRAARTRVRVGGLYVCDNTLWSARVVDPQDDMTRAIVEHNAMIAADPSWIMSINPTRDGLLVAVRTA